MKAGVVIFPGSNCDRDMIHVCEKVMQLETKQLWHKDEDLQGLQPENDVIFLPGGFSYGDYLRSGAIARFSPIMEQVINFANAGGMLIGICNGFQILCEAGLLPGALIKNTQQLFSCKNVHLKVENANTDFTNSTQKNEVLKIPIAHSEGKYFADNATIENLKNNNQILFKYCSAEGEVSMDYNPNGALENIAGICNAARNVFGMMPHPERAAEAILGNQDGLKLFDSILKAKNLIKI